MKSKQLIAQNERLSDAFRHMGHLTRVVDELRKLSDIRGIIEVDGRLIQKISGMYGLKKNDFEFILKLAALYGFVRVDYRTKILRVVS